MHECPHCGGACDCDGDDAIDSLAEQRCGHPILTGCDESRAADLDGDGG